MKIGIPRESKNHEYRVGLTPGAVREALAHGHDVIVETGAGHGIGASDSDYERAGARIALNVDEVFGEVEMIVKVKEPLAAERARLRPHHLLFTYLHLAPDPGQAEDLLASGATAIAYETVTAPGGGLPLLAPMSEVAGRMSIHAGASALEKSRGGSGVLLGGRGSLSGRPTNGNVPNPCGDGDVTCPSGTNSAAACPPGAVPMFATPYTEMSCGPNAYRGDSGDVWSVHPNVTTSRPVVIACGTIAFVDPDTAALTLPAATRTLSVAPHEHGLYTPSVGVSVDRAPAASPSAVERAPIGMPPAPPWPTR